MLKSSPPIPSKPLPEEKELPNLETIGEGVLAASSRFKTCPLPDLAEEVIFWGKNTRPDATASDLCISFGLKRSGQSIKLLSGQKSYLTYMEDKEPHLAFSKNPSPFWIKPYLSERGEAFIDFGLYFLAASEKRLIEEKKSFKLETLVGKGEGFERDANFQKAIFCLKKGAFLDPDCLFGSHGGKEYQKLKNHKRLELDCEGTPSLVHLRQGDYLVWENGRWANVELGKKSQGCALAHVKGESSYRLEFELWSSDGTEKIDLFVEKRATPPLNQSMAHVFSCLRQRTASRVSCRIENKLAILKVGDWVFHSPSGWRVVKSLREVDDILEFRSKGTLFVFDGIERSDGRALFLGTLFNLMRTQVENVKIPITVDPKQKDSLHKKRGFLLESDRTFWRKSDCQNKARKT